MKMQRKERIEIAKLKIIVRVRNIIVDIECADMKER